MDIRRILLTLRQQAWLVAGITTAVLLAFLALPSLGKRVVYISTAKILLTPARANINPENRGMDTSNWLADQSTLTELATSERLLTRICTACNLRTGWQALREQIHLEPLSQDFSRKVNLFALSVEDDSPKQAQKLTEAAVQEFVSYVEELSAREFASTRRFLEELVAEAKEKVDDTEEKLLTLTSSHADASENTAASTTLTTLDTERRRLREEQAILEAEMDSVQSYQSGQTSVIPSALVSKSDAGISQLETSLASAKLKLLDLEQLYTGENLQVIEQRSKIQKMQQLYDGRVQQFITSTSLEKSKLIADKKRQVSEIETRMSEIRNRQLSPSEKRQVAKLERQLNMWEENHLNLVKQLYQARVVEQSSRRQGAITVLENPGPGVEARDRKARGLGARVALGLPFSLGTAVAFVLFFEFIGASMRIVPKIESTLGVAVLAVIPPVDDDLKDLWEAYKRESTLPADRPSLLLYPEGHPPPTTTTG